MIRAYAIGVAILVGDLLCWYLPGHALWFVPNRILQYLDPIQRSLLSDALQWFGLGIAGFVASLLAPRAKVKIAGGLAIAAALLFGLGHLLSPFFGVYVDLPGVQGSIVVAMAAFVVALIFGGLGAVFGWLLTRRGNPQ
jgi:FtsH-binding integral membrane protein